MRLQRFALGVLLVLAALLTSGARAEFPMKLQPMVEVRVPNPPVPYRDRGCVSLVYELLLRSEEWQDVTLKRIEVVGDTDRVLASFEGGGLRRLLERPGFPDPETAVFLRRLAKEDPAHAPPPFQDPIAEPERIGPGLSAILYMWLELPLEVSVPRTLRHRITFEAWHALVPGPAVILAGETAVTSGALAVLEPPLRDGPWGVTNGPSNTSFHRRGLALIDGRLSHPQRFALDLVKTDADGRMKRPGVEGNEAYFGYGEPVLAAARGEIVEAVNDLPENETPGPLARAVPVTWDNIAGNRVTLRLPGGLCVLYAHLKSGSVRVRVGDTVEVGTVLGLLGNSGNSFGPHLHFQVSTGLAMSGQGMPYVLGGTASGRTNLTAVAHEIPRQGDFCWFP